MDCYYTLQSYTIAHVDLSMQQAEPGRVGAGRLGRAGGGAAASKKGGHRTVPTRTVGKKPRKTIENLSITIGNP